MKKIYVIICGVIIALVWGSLTYGELLVNKDREMIESADGTDFNQIKDGRNLFMCEKKVTYKDVTYETTYKDYVYDKEKDITTFKTTTTFKWKRASSNELEDLLAVHTNEFNPIKYSVNLTYAKSDVLGTFNNNYEGVKAKPKYESNTLYLKFSGKKGLNIPLISNPSTIKEGTLDIEWQAEGEKTLMVVSHSYYVGTLFFDAETHILNNDEF